MREVPLLGRIDEIEGLTDLDKLREHLAEITDSEEELDRDLLRYCRMFEPFSLQHETYRVKGIEGALKFYDPETKRIGDTFLMYLPQSPVRPIDLMVRAWHYTLAVAWPNVDHVWFENMTIDEENETITFEMGS